MAKATHGTQLNGSAYSYRRVDVSGHSKLGVTTWGRSSIAIYPVCILAQPALACLRPNLCVFARHQGEWSNSERNGVKSFTGRTVNTCRAASRYSPEPLRCGPTDKVRPS